MTTYTDWLASVKALLSHPDAINCVIDDSLPEVWHESGDSAEDAATELNERHRPSPGGAFCWRKKAGMVVPAESLSCHVAE